MVRLFITAIESLEFGCAFAGDSKSKGYNQWNWFFKKHGQAHALALVLLELNERPIPDEDGLYERAWAAIYGYCEKDLWALENPMQTSKTCIWKPLAKLKDKALKRKMNALGASAQAESFSRANGTAPESNQELPADPTLMVMEDSPIDWVCFRSPLDSQLCNCVIG